MQTNAMEIISTLVSVLSIVILVFLIVYVIKNQIKVNWFQLYVLSGFITTTILIFIVVFTSLVFRNADLATKIWAIYFTDNLPIEILTWFISTTLGEFFIKDNF